jgi:hypothetical protein
MMSNLYYCLEVEGENLSDLIAGFRIEESDSQAGMATLTLRDSHLVLSNLLQEGLNVEIELGRREAHAPIFRGMITSIRPTFPSRGEPQLEVEVMDSLIRLGLRPQTRIWQGKTIGEIVGEIARNNHLCPGRIHLGEGRDRQIEADRPLMQIEETDLAFLYRLAQDYDCKLYVDHQISGDKLNFISTRHILESDPIATPLAFNDNLEEFSVTLDVFAIGARPTELITTDLLSADRLPPETAETPVIPAAGSPAELASAGQLVATHAACVPDVERLARLGQAIERLSRLAIRFRARPTQREEAWPTPARLAGAPSRLSGDDSGTYGDASRIRGQTAQGKATGSIWLHPCQQVRVEGYGGCWSGNWYLTQVEHQLDLEERNYTCSFTCTR